MSKKVLPIKPQNIARHKSKHIPPLVIEAFNELIAKEFGGGSARVVQDDVVKLMVEKGLKRNEIFDNSWLDIEEIFEKAGWEVKYDRPGYCETYDAFWIFSSR